VEFLSKGEDNYLKAKSYIQVGRFKVAAHNLRIAESKNYDMEKVLLLKGIIQLYRMKIAKAFETFQRVLTFTNRNPDAYYYIGKCFVYFGNDEEAYDNFVKSYKHSNNELIKGKSIIELIKICKDDKDRLNELDLENYCCLVKINKDEDEVYRSMAISEMLKGNYLKATEILTELVKKQPRNFEAFKDLAYAFTKMENYELALKSLKKAKAICKHDKTISLELARVFFYLKNYIEARGEMRKTIKLFPPHYKNFYNMGNICSLLTQTTDAVGYYKKCIEINEHFSDAYFNMATVYHAEGMLDDGEKFYKMAEQTAGDRAEIHYNLGLLHYFKRNYFEALSHMLFATKIEPGYENAVHNFRVIKNVKMLNQEDEFKESIPFNTKVFITFISIILFLIVAYIVRLINP
jgi:tetratricopeptide (TPR) repeat protein